MIETNRRTQHNSAITLHGVIDVLPCAKRRDNHRNLVLDNEFHIVHEPVVTLMHNLIDCERCGAITVSELHFDIGEPLAKLFLGPSIQRRERADDASLALRDHQCRVAHYEER